MGGCHWWMNRLGGTWLLIWILPTVLPEVFWLKPLWWLIIVCGDLVLQSLLKTSRFASHLFFWLAIIVAIQNSNRTISHVWLPSHHILNSKSYRFRRNYHLFINAIYISWPDRLLRSVVYEAIPLVTRCKENNWATFRRHRMFHSVVQPTSVLLVWML